MEVSNLGFIDPKTNTLRSQKDIERLEKQQKSDKAGSSQASQVDQVDTSVRNALGNVAARTSEQINGVASTLNERSEDLRSAKRNIQSLRKTARGIKRAIKEGDEEKANALREEFAQLQKERDEIAKRVDQNNQERRLDGPQAVRNGNQTRASFSFSDIEVEGSSEVDTNSLKGLNVFLQDSKEDLQGVRSQIKEDRGVRRELGQLNRTLRQERSGLVQESEKRTSGSINSLEEADLTADSLAKNIASSTLEESIVSNVDQNIAAALLG